MVVETSDGVSRLGLGLETRLETRFWSLGLEGLRSRLGLEGFRSPSRALCLETLHRSFFMKFCKEFLKKTVLKNDYSKFSPSKRSVAKLSLLLCCLRDGENNLPSTPFKIYTELNKNVHAPMTTQRVISATRGWEYFAKDYLWTVFQEFCYETHRLIQKRWESAKKFLFWEAK